MEPNKYEIAFHNIVNDNLEDTMDYNLVKNACFTIGHVESKTVNDVLEIISNLTKEGKDLKEIIRYIKKYYNL